MPKTKLSDILKNGENLTVRKIDPNDPDFIKMCESVKKEQERVKELKRINNRAWKKLKDTIINI